VGHHSALWMLKLISTTLTAARGDLRQAEREAEEAWNFGEAHHIGPNFAADLPRGRLAFLRGNMSEAERWFQDSREPQTHFFGAKEASLFALQAELNDDRAWNSWTERRWNLPRVGQLNPSGDWYALERSVVGLASLGRKEEVAALRPLTEDLIRTGVWLSRSMFPFRTAAGISAAAAGDWAAAEEHHLTAIHQTDTAPYRVSQPLAREWYALMLLDRHAPGDAATARVMLSEALALYESMAMPFHANRTSVRLA
jgi:hypothetical protein